MTMATRKKIAGMHSVDTNGRSKHPASTPSWVLPLVTILVVLVALELATRFHLLGHDFPTVSAVGVQLYEQIRDPSMWHQLLRTLLAWILGFVIAAVVATPLGSLIALNRFLDSSTRLIVDFLRPIPPVAVLPLAVLLFGTQLKMTVIIVAFSAFWPILFQTIYGVHDVDPLKLDTASVFGLGRIDTYRRVVLPSATPYMATGFRLAATIALVVTIATELIVGTSGLGYQINQVRYAGDTAGMYALILITGAIGSLVSWLLIGFERRTLHWHASYRRG
ncbi:ABC transporter permease [Leekyejoonella antrihumi]|uniref:ABC transporter permease n=1 Tax=Leekyejoonella antrihumi TaxID=1660198 RepID=A0A563DSR5_9MICO|nr:ABC transporter permease [Leekyejoonella antrihumi]TWP32971.1 ABC transporter permease [Leekyejoonella antrihumi]